MKRKGYITLGGLFLISVLVLAGCKGHTATANPTQRTLHTTLQANPITLDPTKSIDVPSSSMKAQAYQGLYTLSKNNKIIPGVATKVASPTDNDKTYTFTLRKNAKWSNGDPVVAADFVNAFQHWADPKSKSQSADKLVNFVNFNKVNSGKAPLSALGVKAFGKYKFQIKLTKPVPYLKYMLAANFMPVNTRLLKEYGQKYGSNSKKTAYNGAYDVSGWTGVNDAWTYSKNTKFWDKQSVHIDKIKVQVAKDDNTSQNLFKSDNIQETTVSGNYARQNQHNPALHTSLTATMYYLYFNNHKPITSNENFRKAISNVIDRQVLTKNVLGDGSLAATGMVSKEDMRNPKTGQDFATESGKLVSTDIPKAKKYWSAAKSELKKSNYTLTLLADSTDDQKQLAQYLQEVAEKNLKGLKVIIKTEPHAQHVSESFAANFDINVTDWNTEWPDAADLLDLIQKGNKLNFTNFSDSTFDNLMERAATQTNASARYATLQKANKRIAETAAAVPLYQQSSAHLISPDLKGINYSLFTSVPRYQYAYWK